MTPLDLPHATTVSCGREDHLQSPVDPQAVVTYSGRLLKVVHKHRCLGVIIDDKLSFSEHVLDVTAKVSRKIGCLRRIRRQLTPQARRLYLLGIIQSDLVYARVATSTLMSCRDRDRLSSLFRRAVRAVFGATPLEDAAPLMEQLKVCPLEDRWMLRLAVFAFRSIHGRSAACLKNMLMAQDSSSHYNNRGQAAGN